MLMYLKMINFIGWFRSIKRVKGFVYVSFPPSLLFNIDVKT